MYRFKYIRDDLQTALFSQARAAGLAFTSDADNFIVVHGPEHAHLDRLRRTIDESVLGNVLWISSDSIDGWRAERDAIAAQGISFIEYEATSEPQRLSEGRSVPSHQYGIALRDESFEDDIGPRSSRQRAHDEALADGIRPGKRTAIVYALDDSTSVHEQGRLAAQREVLAVDSWLDQRNAPHASRFLLFNHRAREVSRARFMSLRQRRGCIILPRALQRVVDIAEGDYSVGDWDILVVLFSAGLPRNDRDSVHLLRERLLPEIVAFGYAQLLDPSGRSSDGPLIQDLEDAFRGDPRMVTTYLRAEGDFARAFGARVDAIVAHS